MERPKNIEEPSPLKRSQTSASSDDTFGDGEGQKEGGCWLLEDYAHHPDEHILLDSPAETSVHERFLIQLPIEQVLIFSNENL